MTSIAALPHRALIRLSGPDRVTFLNGLVSNDIEKAKGGHAVWAAFLTPQGKFLHDMFVAEDGEDLLIDCETDRRDDLITRLARFKLRSDVQLTAEDNLNVYAAWGGNGPDSGIWFQDPRHADAGIRLWTSALECNAALDDYDTHRITLGLPDGSRDMEVEKALLLENGFDELNGVDYQKGCYIGQELTARTHYRALIKKRLLPVTFDGEPPAPGTDIQQGDKSAGVVKSGVKRHALALIRLEALDEPKPLIAEGVTLRASVPDWVKLPTQDTATR